MSYTSKVWVDRQATNPGRRKLTSVDDPTDIKYYDVERADNPTVQGDPYDAASMNGLENRISLGFSTCAETLTGTTAPDAASGKVGDLYFQTQTENNVTTVVAFYVKTASATWTSVSVGGEVDDYENVVFPVVGGE